MQETTSQGPHWRIVITVVVIVVAAVAGGLLWYKKTHPPVVQHIQPVVIGHSLSIEKIGTSVEGRSIDAYTFSRPQATGTSAKRLVFVGGIHGGYEWNSALLAYDFIDYFTVHPDAIPANITLTIIPDANPDGVYKVLGKEGKFALADVPASEKVANTGAATGFGRFNAHNVDLNRNFDCKWQPESTWRSKKVSAGTSAFSEPEARAIRDFVTSALPASRPDAVVFWHSQSNAVYASECKSGILPETRTAMNLYAKAAGYKAVDTFDSYAVTGDAEGWLASIGVPAITVELATHTSTEWDKNLAGVKALLAHYGKQQ